MLFTETRNKNTIPDKKMRMFANETTLHKDQMTQTLKNIGNRAAFNIEQK